MNGIRVCKSGEPDQPVDLVERQVHAEDATFRFDIDDYTRWRLMEGLDDIGLTMRHAEDIDAFEARRPAWMPKTLPARIAETDLPAGAESR